MFVHANGIDHHVALAGPSSGPAVLLVHGLGWDHTLWAGQIETLADLGWRVVAPDLRGMGRTDKPDAPYSVDLYAEDMLVLTTALGIPRFALAGFSLGGIVAAAMIGKAPQRIAAALIACCGLHSAAEGEAATEAMLARAAGLGPLAFAREQAEAISHPDFAAAHPRIIADFIQWRASMDQAALTRAFRSTYGIDYRPVFDGASLPVRFLAADRDPFASIATLEDLRSRVRGADLVVIENAGHMAPIEQRAAFDAALSGFLEPLRAGLS